MKILIITLFYPPEPLKIFSDLAENLFAIGHDVTVLTTFPNHPKGKVYTGYSNTWPKSDVLNGVRVIRVPFYPNRSRSAIKRTLSYLSFMVMTCLFGPWLIPRSDIIYSVEPPSSALTAWFLSKLWHVPFVYEILDMWPESLRDSGMLTNQKALEFVGWFCRWLYRQAAALRVVSEGQQKNLLIKGVPQNKVFLIPVWIDTEYYAPMEFDLELASELGVVGNFNIVYTGNLGTAQGLETVLSAADELRALPEVQFLIFGDGVEGSLLRKKVEQMGLKNIKFMGSYPNSSMKRVCSIADCLLVHLHDKPAFCMAIPHKILSYLACGKPIIAAVKGDGAEVIYTANAGIICKPNDSAELAQAIRVLLKMNLSERSLLGHNGRLAAISTFKMTSLVKKIEQMLVQIIQQDDLDLKK